MLLHSRPYYASLYNLVNPLFIVIFSSFFSFTRPFHHHHHHHYQHQPQMRTALILSVHLRCIFARMSWAERSHKLSLRIIAWGIFNVAMNTAMASNVHTYHAKSLRALQCHKCRPHSPRYLIFKQRLGSHALCASCFLFSFSSPDSSRHNVEARARASIGARHNDWVALPRDP
eukprot:8782952-Pyramimonas_sp.AAC.1